MYITIFMKKFWKKYHKWVGLFFAIFVLNFCFSGIILNHRKAFSRCELSRTWMPKDYSFKNWNNGIIRGAEPLDEHSTLLYGETGIWKTDSSLSAFTSFNEGLDEGIDNRKIRNILTMPDGSIWCSALWDIYRIAPDGKSWFKQELPGNKDRLTDIASRGDTLVAMTRDRIYEALPPYTEFTVYELPAPKGYTGKVGLFRQVWLLHSGELFGLVGKLIVDALALILIFLSITGIIFTVAPKCIKRRRMKQKNTAGAVKTMKFSTKWHIKIGTWLFVPTLILAVTGMCLRPPMMFPFVMTSSKPIPGTTLDSDNAWHDKLRSIRWDEQESEWLLSTSEGFFKTPDFETTPILEPVAPPLSPEGINVFEKCNEEEWLIGSFAGLYRWNRQTGAITDYMNDEAYDPTKRSFYGTAVANGFSREIVSGKEIVFDYGKGAITRTGEVSGLPEMPEEMKKQPMSLWNFGLELHVGRCYTPFIGPLSSMFVFIAGLLLTLTLISGYVLRPKRKKK